MSTEAMAAEVRRSSQLLAVREKAYKELLESGALMNGGHFQRHGRCSTEHVNRHKMCINPDRSLRLACHLKDLLEVSVNMNNVQFVAGPEGGGALIADKIAGMLSSIRPIGQVVYYVEIAKDSSAEYGYLSW